MQHPLIILSFLSFLNLFLFDFAATVNPIDWNTMLKKLSIVCHLLELSSNIVKYKSWIMIIYYFSTIYYS